MSLAACGKLVARFEQWICLDVLVFVENKQLLSEKRSLRIHTAQIVGQLDTCTAAFVIDTLTAQNRRIFSQVCELFSGLLQKFPMRRGRFRPGGRSSGFRHGRESEQI